MIVSISSHKRAAVRFIFDNGNEVSIVWGGGSYTENHDDFSEFAPPGLHEHLSESESEAITRLFFRNKPPTRWMDPVASTTVEIMVDGPELEKWFTQTYESNPAGYIPVNEIPKILKEADDGKYQDKKQ